MNIYDEMSDGLKNVNYHFIDMLFKQETKKASENTEGIVWYEQIYGWINQSSFFWTIKVANETEIIFFRILNKQPTRKYFFIGFIFIKKNNRELVFSPQTNLEN